MLLLGPAPLPCAGPASYAATEGHTIELVGQAGGPNYGIDFDGEFLYVGRGNRLLVVDVSDPSSPREHAATAPLPGTVYDVVVVDAFAYLAVGPGLPWHPGDPEHPDMAGLYIMDVSDPGEPALVGFADTPGSARSVDVDGGIAVVAQSDVAGLQVVDVSNPRDPHLLGSAPRRGHLNTLLDVAVRDDYAYAVYGYGSGYGGDNLGVIDLADPTAPRMVAALGMPGRAERITLAHGYAYVAARLGGLRIIDISDPESPRELGSILESEEKNSSYWVTDVSVDGGLAYVARSESLHVIDVSDPTAPLGIGVARHPVNHVVVDEERVFGLHEEHGPQVYDCSDPNRPKLHGEILFISPAVKDLTLDGHRLYALTWDSLHVADVTDPEWPRFAGRVSMGGEAHRVSVSSGYAYVAHLFGVQVVDVSDSDAPRLIREVTPPSRPPYSPMPIDVEATRDHLFVFVKHWDCPTHVSCYGYYALHAFDITRPTSPRHLSELVLEDAYSPPTTDEWDPLHLGRNLAYVASGHLYLVDVSRPSELRLVGVAETHGRSRSVMERGLHAYVADRDGLDVFDVSIPGSPAHIAFLKVFHRPHEYLRDVYAIGDGVVALSRYGAIALLDIANPGEPAEVALYEPASAIAHDVHVSAGRAFVAGGRTGVLVYRVPTLRAPFEVFLPSAELGAP